MGDTKRSIKILFRGVNPSSAIRVVRACKAVQGYDSFCFSSPVERCHPLQTSCDDGEEIKSTTEKNVQIHWKVNQREDSAGAFGTAAGPWCHCFGVQQQVQSMG